MKITCVCGMGMGSSLIAKMNIESIVSQMGVEAEVDNCDLGSVSSKDSDWYVTTRELAGNMPEAFQEKTIILTDFISIDSIKDELVKHLQ